MSLYLGTKEQVQQYFDDKGVNQSSLKNMEDSLDAYLAAVKKYSESDGNEPHFIIGGAVDTLLTSTEEDFEQQYFISKGNTPTESIANVVKTVFEDMKKDNVQFKYVLSSYPDYIEAACLKNNYQKAWKIDTKIKKIVDEGSLYFQELAESDGKKILDVKTEELVRKIVKNLKTGEFTNKYFDREFFESTLEMDIYYQLPIYFIINGIKCKGLLDMLIVFKNSDNIPTKLLPVDLKTRSGYVIEFEKSVNKRRYDLQASWYSDALLNPTVKSSIKAFNDTLALAKENNIELEILPFEFVVESTTSPGTPLVFVCDETLLEQGRNGKYNSYKEELEKEGYLQLLDKYKFYQETGFRIDKKVFDFGGRIPLKA